MKKHLEPLARASCILQAAHARLDQVPLIFGTLIKEYQDILKQSPDDEELINVIITSIEKRWAASDQDIFIAAVILHPSYKTTPFAHIPLVTPASIWNLFRRLWKHFYRCEAPSILLKEYQDYAKPKLNGTYHHLIEWSEQIRREAIEKVSNIHHNDFWHGLDVLIFSLGRNI